MNRYVSEQEQEHWDHVAGSASEAQNCFEEANHVRRVLDGKQQALIAEALNQGKFVVVDAQPYHCKATDAIAGEVRYFHSAHISREAANRAAGQLSWQDPDARAYVLPELPQPEVIPAAALDNSDVPF